MEDLSLGFDKHDDTVQIIKTLTSSIWPLALLLCLSACAPMGRPIGGGGGGSDPFAGGSRPAPQDIELRVRNLNFNDARLYAVAEDHAAVWVKLAPSLMRRLRSRGRLRTAFE